MFCLTNETAEIFSNDWTDSLKIQCLMSQETCSSKSQDNWQLKISFFFNCTLKRLLSPAIAKPVSQPPDLSSLDVEVTSDELASLPFPHCLPCHMYCLCMLQLCAF